MKLPRISRFGDFGYDALVVEFSGCLNLFLEAPNQFLGTQSVRPKHFDGDNATGSAAGLKHRTHSPILTDLFQEFVSAKD